MAFHPIDRDTWDRAERFEHYFSQVPCFYSMTVDLDLTDLKRRGGRFYPAVLYSLAVIVNRHREFRMAYDTQGQLGYYDQVHPEYTVLDPVTHNMDSLNTAYNTSFPAFYQAMTKDLDRFHQESIRTGSRENSILLSCVPWFSYTDVSFHPNSSLMFLRPMFVWGKYQETGESASLPFTIQVHHAAADGYHCHLLLEDLTDLLEHPHQNLL